MECVETLAAAGRGKWGDHPADFALSTVRRTWPARVGDETRSADTFRLSFQLAGYAPDFRQFDIEAQRDAFFNANISGRTSGGKGRALLQGCTSWGKELVGEPLEGVTFVAD